MEVTGWHHTPAALPPGKDQYALNEAGWAQRRRRRLGEEENLFLRPIFEPRTANSCAQAPRLKQMTYWMGKYFMVMKIQTVVMWLWHRRWLLTFRKKKLVPLSAGYSETERSMLPEMTVTTFQKQSNSICREPWNLGHQLRPKCCWPSPKLYDVITQMVTPSV
jgi:hypothetical protein